MKNVRNEYTIRNLVGFTHIGNANYIVVERQATEKCFVENIKDLSIVQKLRVIGELIKIVDHFHNKLHMSLKVLSSNNIFFDKGKLKLNVSNLRKIIQECSIDKNKKDGLYFEYISPEFFDLESGDVDKEFDDKAEHNIWSLGTIISEVFSGIVPWHNKNKNEIAIVKMLVKKMAFPIPEKVSQIHPDLNKLIEMCTKINPSERPSIVDVLNAVENILNGKNHIYSLMLSFNSKKNLLGMKRKYLITSIYKYL